jgi:Ca2+-binding RTX toxin-like protein
VRQNQQVTYDPAAEFSPDTNPSNVWSYGYSDKLNDPTTTYDTATNQNQIDYWTASQLANTSTLAPDVLHNGSGDTESPGINDGVLALDPGFYGEYSHVTFTAPTSGSYDITGTFGAAINDGNPTTDVHVLVNGESQFDSELGVEGPGGDFDLPGFFLNAGDTVDFTVGFGSNGNFDGDTTSLDAEITRTSAPDDRTFAVARLTGTGQLDPNFNLEQGFNFMDVGTDETVSSVALQALPDDFGAQRIVVGGSDDGNFVVARFLPDGTQDFDFGDNGGYTSNSIEFGGTLNAIAVDADNNIYAVGAVDATAGGFSATPLGAPPPTPLTAVLAKYDANGSFIGQTEHSSDATDSGASYNAVSVDSHGRILVAGDDGQDYIVGRYTNDLNFDITFADGPITTDLAPAGSLGSTDKAILVTELPDGKIIAAGSSNVEDQFESSHLETSAARYVGGPAEGNPFDIEEFIDTNDFSNPPPDLVPHLENISGPALLYLESQPDDNGNVDIHTNNPKGDVVKITTVVAADGTKNDAVTVNGVTTFYAVLTTNSITINTDGGADSVIADNSVTTKLIIYTGEGDDTVTGGGGTNFIFGGGGSDKLNGGPKGDVVIGGAGEDSVNGNGGNDIVIGGPNNDHVNGGSGDDIVIPGTTAYDSDLSALSSLLAEWTSSHSFTTRVNNIKSGSSGGLNDPFFLRPTGSDKTVIDDSDIDSLTGGLGRDLFFRKNSGPNKDLITDLNTGAGDQVVNF